MEKIGFVEKKNQDQKQQIFIMPNVKNVNNYVGVKNSFYKSLPKNMSLDKVE